MRNRRRWLVAVAALVCALLVGGCALSGNDTFEVSDKSTQGFGTLLCDLVSAYETPASDDAQTIEKDLHAIEKIDARDGEVARDIAERWKRVYLDPTYELCLYGGGKQAPELERAGLPDDVTHAFVILGYELKDGEMTDELKGRCDAAAAAARSYPKSLLVCTGGATGENNPNKHTEAGLMKEYLVKTCGLDESRIHTDESAMTTAENAQNTMRILREEGVKTMTLVTSSYHQRWAQTVYAAVVALEKQQHSSTVEIVGDYSYEIEPSVKLYKSDDRLAVMQIAQILSLPQEVVETLPELPGM